MHECVLPVRKDCGLKSPDSQTTLGRERSWVQLSSSLQRCNTSLYLTHTKRKKNIFGLRMSAFWTQKINNNTHTHTPYSQAVGGGVGQLGPGIRDVVKEQGRLQLLHLRGDGQFTLWKTLFNNCIAQYTQLYCTYTCKHNTCTPWAQGRAPWASAASQRWVRSCVRTPGSRPGCTGSVQPSSRWCRTCCTPLVASPAPHPK